MNPLHYITRFASLRGTKQSRQQTWIASSFLLANRRFNVVNDAKRQKKANYEDNKTYSDSFCDNLLLYILQQKRRHDACTENHVRKR